MRTLCAFSWFLAGILCTATVSIGALAVARKLRTGSWATPSAYDLMWMERQVHVDREPPRVIYLRRDAITLRAGIDDSHDDRSSIVTTSGAAERTLPGFNGTDSRWRAIVKCVDKRFKPYNVRVTDQRPRAAGYVMVAVGGKPSDLDLPKQLTGIAPTRPDDVVHDPVAFVFARALKNNARDVCETIAHEAGHTYGLDHSYSCKDVMSYLGGCGARNFADKELRCGEHAERDCDSDAPTQNSHQLLLDVLGPREQAMLNV